MQSITALIEQLSNSSAANHDRLSLAVTHSLERELAELFRRSDDIDGAMISSVDGMAWAHHSRAHFDAHRFAAMSSALIALCDSLAQESKRGVPRNVLIESQSGNILALHAGDSLLLTVFTKGSAPLGIALAHARQCAERISALAIAA
jgi:predicted regulator of Ras-like GTPase activity (Roadblock/LC7/MglB family)